MARTHGVKDNFHLDEGEIYGKGGEPIQANPRPQAPIRLSGDTVIHGPGVEAVAAPKPIVGYRADRTTFTRNMDAWDLAMLLDLALSSHVSKLGDGFIVECTEAEYLKMIGDLRRHFKPVRADDPAAS